MRWINFPDGSSYTFAADIQKTAELMGYKVPCDADGTRHPGTDCNAKMHTIFRDVGMRRTFGVVEQSVVDIDVNENFANTMFMSWVIDSGLWDRRPRNYVVQLYSIEAVNALLSKMLDLHVEYVRDYQDEDYYCPVVATKRSHNLEKRRNKPKASLFNR